MNDSTKPAFVARPAADTPPAAGELDNLDFQIEAAEYDQKQKAYMVNHAFGQARIADDEGIPGLAALWRWRAEQQGEEIKAFAVFLKDAKGQRRRLTRGAVAED